MTPIKEEFILRLSTHLYQRSQEKSTHTPLPSSAQAEQDPTCLNVAAAPSTGARREEVDDEFLTDRVWRSSAFVLCVCVTINCSADDCHNNTPSRERRTSLLGSEEKMKKRGGKTIKKKRRFSLLASLQLNRTLNKRLAEG